MKSHRSYPLAAMKAAVIERVLRGEVSVTEAARSVKKSRFSIYAWMTRYKAGGVDGLLPRKTGPKGGRSWNRTNPETETLILQALDDHPQWNIYDIAEHLPEEHRVHPCTVWRIWKRHRCRDQTKRWQLLLPSGT